MTYAFTFDASACTGCKACQIACKDKNNLPTGVLWRRVYEVSGGMWTSVGAGSPRPELTDHETRAGKPGPYSIWQTDVFAYNLSLACNHCVHPKCAGVCPVDAYVVRPDGIVYIDESKCMGCGYCAWACPYSAPRYNPELGHMTKCNFCFDNLDAGLPPACVAACPLRVLDFTVVSEQLSVSSESHQPLWEVPGTEHPFPLPVFSRTQPHVALKPHAGMVNGLEKTISNWEEINPPLRVRRTNLNGKFSSGKVSRLISFLSKVWCDALRSTQELPLIIFTLCGQMAAGLAVFGIFFQLARFQLLLLGGLLAVAALASLTHLGTPRNAWRAFSHLNKSWLSREILVFGLFGASWLAWLAESWFLKTNYGALSTGLLGLGLVHSMAQVYRIKAVPAWNSWRTNAAFFLSAGVLGLTGAASGTGLAAVWFPLWALLAAEAGLQLIGKKPAHETGGRLRVVGSALAMVGVGILPVVPVAAQMWLPASISMLILLEELLGRWQFYRALEQRVL